MLQINTFRCASNKYVTILLFALHYVTGTRSWYMNFSFTDPWIRKKLIAVVRQVRNWKSILSFSEIKKKTYRFYVSEAKLSAWAEAVACDFFNKTLIFYVSACLGAILVSLYYGPTA